MWIVFTLPKCSSYAAIASIFGYFDLRYSAVALAQWIASRFLPRLIRAVHCSLIIVVHLLMLKVFKVTVNCEIVPIHPRISYLTRGDYAGIARHGGKRIVPARAGKLLILQ